MHKRHVVSTLLSMIILVSLAGCGSGSGTSTPTPEPRVDPNQPTAETPNALATLGTPSGDVTLGTLGTLIPITTMAAEAPCSSPTNKDSFMSWDQYSEAVRCTVPLFPWPRDRQFDADAFLASAKPEDASKFQGGYQYSLLANVNQCAWYETWMDARAQNDAKQEQAALFVIVYVIPSYSDYIPGYPAQLLDDASTTRLLIRVAQSAQLGDPALVQDMLDGFCTLLPDWISESAP